MIIYTVVLDSWNKFCYLKISNIKITFEIFMDIYLDLQRQYDIIIANGRDILINTFLNVLKNSEL